MWLKRIDAAEHRDRRRRRLGSAARRLGRGDRPLGGPALGLFALIFLWTPPHFWSLALMTETDYDKAGIPMLPNVHGRRAPNARSSTTRSSGVRVAAL